MPRVFVGLGSNEGDRFGHLSDAVAALTALKETRVVQMAPIIETEPIGGPPQENYLNTVVELATPIPPLELLAFLKEIEKRQGRRMDAPRWGPRPIDLDLLLYGQAIIHQPRLTVPHPRMHERRFVLQPLAELDASLKHPVLKQSVGELLAVLPQASSLSD